MKLNALEKLQPYIVSIQELSSVFTSIELSPVKGTKLKAVSSIHPYIKG